MMNFKIIFMIFAFGFNQVIHSSCFSTQSPQVKDTKKVRQLSEFDKSLFKMHPCHGVCVCGCYLDRDTTLDRLCDIGCEPLNDIRLKKEGTFFGCHCADKDCFKKECLAIFCYGLFVLDEAACSLSGVYFVAECNRTPLTLDNDVEKLEISHPKVIRLELQKLLDNPFECIQNHNEKIFIPNPCQAIKMV